MGLIAPQLAFHEVRGVRLLGTAGWNDPGLIRLGGSHVHGAVFTAPFFAGSRRPFVMEFVRRYRATFRSDPGELAAQGFDAAYLVLAEIARGAAARDAVLTGLLGVHDVLTAGGPISIDLDGGARKRWNLLAVDRGRIVSLDEAGAAPELRPREPAPAAEEEPSA